MRHCSKACRRRGLTAEDAALEEAFLTLLAQRPRNTPVTDEDAARHLAADGWPRLREPARAAARRLAAAGRAVFTAGGRRADPSTARGPIALRPP